MNSPIEEIDKHINSNLQKQGILSNRKILKNLTQMYETTRVTSSSGYERLQAKTGRHLKSFIYLQVIKSPKYQETKN